MGRRIDIFPKKIYRYIQMANGYVKKWSISLIIKEIQIKTTMRYHLTSVRKVIIKKTKNNKYWWRCRGKGTLVHCWECKLVQPLWKIAWSFKIKKMKVPYDPTILLLGIYLKKIKTLTGKDISTPTSLQHYLQ